jgi:hypothetical protein
MEDKGIFCLVLVFSTHFGTTLGEIFTTSRNENTEVTQYISRLIRDASEKSQDRVSDVVVISLSSRNENVFDDIVKEISSENALIVPSNEKPVNDQRIRAASFIIIISDTMDAVS